MVQRIGMGGTVRGLVVWVPQYLLGCVFTVGTGILFGFVWRSCGGVSSACVEASLCLVDMVSWLLRSFGPIWFGTST